MRHIGRLEQKLADCISSAITEPLFKMRCKRMARSHTDLVESEEFWSMQRQIYFPFVTNNGWHDFSVASIGTPFNQRLVRKMSTLPYPQTNTEKQKCKSEVERTRYNLSNSLHVPENNLFFTNTTHHSFKYVLDLLLVNGGLQPGDNIVSTTSEYINLKQYFSDFDFTLVRPTISDISEAITSRTKAVFASHVTHATCQILPVEEIVKLSQSKGIISIIDGAQALGQIPVDLSDLSPDFYIGCGHKWFRSQATVGLLYMRNPSKYKHSIVMIESPYGLPPNLRTVYEEEQNYSHVGNSRAISHLGHALEYSLLIGFNVIFKRIAHLGKYARDVFSTNKSIVVLSDENDSPGMIGIVIPKVDFDHTVPTNCLESELENKYRISTTAKPGSLRVAISPFNTKSEIDYLNQALSKIAYSFKG